MRPPFMQPLSPSHARVRWRSEGTPNPVGLAAQQSHIACTFLHHVATAKSPSISTPVYYPWPNRTSTTIWFWRTCVSITPTPHLSLTADSAFFPSVSTRPPPLPPPPRPIFCVSTCLPPFLPPPRANASQRWTYREFQHHHLLLRVRRWGQFFVAAAMLGIGLVWAFIRGWQLTLAGLTIAPVFAITTAVQTKFVVRCEVRNKRGEGVGRDYYDVRFVLVLCTFHL